MTSGCPTKRSCVRTGQRLLGDGKWLADVAILDHDDDGQQLFAQLPADKDFTDIVINPARVSGQPTFVGTRVSPVTIAGMANGGVPHEDLAVDYGVSLHHIQQAIDHTEKYGLAGV
jgi:uncharacterized protein (DUF433 family)